MRNRFFLLMDFAACYLSFLLLDVIVWPLADVMHSYVCSLSVVIASSVIYILVMSVSGVYSINWVYASVKEYIQFFNACCVSVALSVGAGVFFRNPYVFLKLNLAANAGVVTIMCGFRIAVRILHRLMIHSTNTNAKRVLIIGAGQLAVTLLRDIWNNQKMPYQVVGLIDDDPEKKNMKICGARVLGTRDDILRICQEKQVDEVIFAIYHLSADNKKALLDICSESGCKVMIMPGIEAALHGVDINQIREIDIEDLLERDPIVLDNRLIENDIKNKTVLVTGGGGSIGSELCRQLVRYNPRTLIVFDIYENNAFELQQELIRRFPMQNIEVLIGSVRDVARLEELFSTYSIDIVFHAAAHKHVPLMEDSPCEAIKNNVFGTYNTATCAKRHGVKKFVLISTDKAVNPTNVMGASKRICEMIVQTLSRDSETDFAAVRFGNVLGSNGSVIPLFKKQINAGGPVTVTHPEITRFFMTIPEAAQLVLQAASYAHGGEIFVLDMGQPVKIYDLAKKMISLSGFKPDEDIAIEFTGLRPGEKLYEELLMNEEGLKTTNHDKIFVGQPLDMSVEKLEEILVTLREAVTVDGATLREVVASVVPTYHQNEQK
ncbi:MAG: polysaccharide biosynthesis protein [Ruminococcaceae bacterium]|nr:polysaccharide biosynthesis protein [Oscillospiraceae bacterium]